MAKPGVMFYFDIRPCLKRLSIEDKGMLFEAILDYAEHGIEPDFDGVVGVAWDFIKPGIDRDSDRYGNQVLQKQYAAYVREAKKKGQTPLSFDDWKSIPDSERYPTTATTPTPTPTPTPTTTTATTATMSKAAKPPTPTRKPKKSFGEFGWVKLTDDEYNRLLSDLGDTELKRCIAYVDESAQTTNNKNRWSDWNLVVRKCHRDGWGLHRSQPVGGQRPSASAGAMSDLQQLHQLFGGEEG